MSTIFTAKDRIEAMERLIADSYSIIPTALNRIKVSEWAESQRVLPEGLSPYPGPYSFDMVPFMREIVDCLSETSPVQEVALMKGTQVAATVGLGENWIGYVIDSAPAPMGYISGDEQMAQTQMELRIDALINSAGLDGKIASQHKRAKQRKTGDVRSRKEFPGGFLLAGGPRSAFFKRNMSLKYIYSDEIDAWPESIRNEGSPMLIIRRRVDAFTESYKILWTSTPLIDHTSYIKQLYAEGDESRYFVPCKHCGHMQYLKWGQLKFTYDDEYRLDCTLDSDGNILRSSVRYQCEKCGGEWENNDKDWFLPRGEWRPTKTPRRPRMRSFHLPGLYSPVGFRSWESGVMEFLDCKRRDNPKYEYQVWVNTFLGETFIDEGEKPRLESIITRERQYVVNELPEEAKPLIVTIGADVQIDRIECEIVAWGTHAESWSVDYRIFYGDTSDPDDECWQQLRQIITEKHAGLHVTLAGVDAGYRTDVVYQFADTFDSGVHPVMGYDDLGSRATYTKLRHVNEAATPRLDMNVDLLKQRVYSYLSKQRYEDGRKPVGYCNFPADYDRDHFVRLTAESRIPTASGRYVWDAAGRRNEQLDCRVYALGLVHALKQFVEESFGMDPGTMTWPDFWAWAEAEIEAQ